MKYLKRILVSLIGVMILSAVSVNARSIRTPEGNMPLVHWAVVESTDSNMQKIIDIGAKVLAPVVPSEPGTYCLYGGIDVTNLNVMRLLEIYESVEAYRIHGSSEAFQQYRAERLPFLKGLKILEVNGIVLEQKSEGIGTIVYMRRIEVEPAQLAKYQQLVSNEAIRAVREDSGVMGMFITAEQANPNIIHIMEIYKNVAAYENYINSQKYQELTTNIKSMILSSKTIENLPTKIILSEKGGRL